MTSLALNQMTMPHAPIFSVLDVAQSLDFAGVELRNDLSRGVFDGEHPEVIRDAAAERGLRILALAEVYGFNDDVTLARARVADLAGLAQRCGAEAIVLIPQVANHPVPRDEQRELLRRALTALRPILEQHGVFALIEPLGFKNSTLRFKADAIAVMDELGRPECFALVHDTFHHALAGEPDVFGDATRVVHVSGVAGSETSVTDLRDVDRGFVDADDRLGNIDQISQLKQQGFAGPFSFEVFAPDVHALDDPAPALAASTTFITSKFAHAAAPGAGEVTAST